MSVPGMALGVTATGITSQTALALGVQLRFIFKLLVSGLPGDVAWSTFDMHVLLDHA